MKQLTLLFLLKDNSILLAMKKRGFGAGRWNGVGGKVEEGESINDAAMRECQEEIGVTPHKLQKVAEITFEEQYEETKTTFFVTVFTTESWDGKPTESEEMAPEWFAKNKIPYDTMWADDPYWLPRVLEGERLRASFVLDSNDALIKHSVKNIINF